MPRSKKATPDGVSDTAGSAAKELKPRQRRSKDLPKEAVVLIPFTFNDGSEIPSNKFDAILDQIFLGFEGWTIEGTVKGAYRMSSGHKKVEDSLKISIVLKESDIPTLMTMAGEWASELDQEAILVKITDFTVYFVPPRSQEEE